MNVKEAEEKAKAEAEAKVKAEADLKAKAEAEAKAKAEASVKAEAEAKAKAEATKHAEEQSGRGRIKAILDCEEAKGREALAKHLALETDTTLESAKGILAKSPKSGAGLLDKVMQNFAPGVTSMEVEGGAPAVNLDPSGVYSRRAEQYNKAAAK